MKKTTLFAALSASVFISGCASTQVQTQGSYPASASVMQIISQESQEAMRATQKLNKYRQQHNQTLDYRHRSFENDVVMIDYIGKPPAVLNSLAIRYGYRFLEVGVRQDLPTVNFTRYENTPEMLVMDIDAQLGDSGQISLDKQQKVITLIYPQVAQ